MKFEILNYLHQELSPGTSCADDSRSTSQQKLFVGTSEREVLRDSLICLEDVIIFGLVVIVVVCYSTLSSIPTPCCFDLKLFLCTQTFWIVWFNVSSAIYKELMVSHTI